MSDQYCGEMEGEDILDDADWAADITAWEQTPEYAAAVAATEKLNADFAAKKAKRAAAERAPIVVTMKHKRS